MPYHFPIKVGDRVALAPHLDIWMQGVRFGTCNKVAKSERDGSTIYRVSYDGSGGGGGIWMSGDDLLGAVRHPSGQTPLDRLRHHVSGAVERGEAEPIGESNVHGIMPEGTDD